MLHPDGDFAMRKFAGSVFEFQKYFCGNSGTIISDVFLRYNYAVQYLLLSGSIFSTVGMMGHPEFFSALFQAPLHYVAILDQVQVFTSPCNLSAATWFT